MAHSFLGELYVMGKNFTLAIEAYQKVLALNPDDEIAQTRLKQTIEKVTEVSPKEAQKKANAEVKKDEKKAAAKISTATVTIAELYMQQGHFEKAVEVFQELLAEDPQNLLLRQKLSEAMETHQKQRSLENSVVDKLKKDEFVRPPDLKEDKIEEILGVSNESSIKATALDDSKFTSEDILQVMQFSQSEVPLEEETKTEPAEIKKQLVEKKHLEPLTNVVQQVGSSGITLAAEPDSKKQRSMQESLAKLQSVEGIVSCVFFNPNGDFLMTTGMTIERNFFQSIFHILTNSQHAEEQLNHGLIRQVILKSEQGQIFLMKVAQYNLMVLANEKINIGRLRVVLETTLNRLASAE
jgi:tetratricopeptide (TPR) repeat protein